MQWFKAKPRMSDDEAREQHEVLWLSPWTPRRTDACACPHEQTCKWLQRCARAAYRTGKARAAEAKALGQ